MPRRVVLTELDQDGPVLAIGDAHAAALSATGLVTARLDRAGWRLLPAGRVGSVRIDELQVDVLPKDRVHLTSVLFLLGFAADPGWRPENVHADAHDDLWPALAESLTRLARAALGPGVLQGYRTTEDAMRTVRGRIRIGDQVTRRPGLMVPIEVTFDEFTVDIAENQILRTALRRMLAVPRLSPAAHAGLGHLDGLLTGVSILPPGAPLPEWLPDRRNARYAPALRLAEIVLANSSAGTSAGGLTVAGFVVDMGKVYEDFVGTALREALARFPGGTHLQFRARLDAMDRPGDPPAIPLRVDIVHMLQGRPVLVFDAKYKAADPRGRYPNADCYQMLAYCTALQVPTAWLVYAGGGSPAARRIANTAITVVEHPLDLGRAPVEMLDQVDRLAEAAWRST